MLVPKVALQSQQDIQFRARCGRQRVLERGGPTTTLRGTRGREGQGWKSRPARLAKKCGACAKFSRMRVAREWGCLDPQCRDQLGNTQTVHWKLEIPSSSPSFSSPRLKKKTICEFKPCRCHARLDLWLNTSDRTVNRRASRQTDACCSGLRRKKKGRKAWLHPWQEKWEPTWPSKRREADVLSHPRLFAGKLNPLLTSKNNRLRSSINSSFSPGDPR